jgi:ornithine cyclodeaminase/alanine dehydrogenase-like protein (mu-crystallin family)
VRTFVERGRDVTIWDLDEDRARAAADELGATVAPSLGAALGADIVVTVTPGHLVLFGDGSLAPGQHVSLMGADGPGKAEISPTELVRTRMFCDDWEQASHGGELAQAFEAQLVAEPAVGRLGAVLAGTEEGRMSASEITTFDSTGLAIQDLAIALAALSRAGELELATLEL